MPGTRSKYSPQQTAEWEGEIMVILAESEEAMTIDEIRAQSGSLVYVSSQKIARILSHLIEMGMVRKGFSNSKKKMLYKSVAVMQKEGFI